MSVADRRAACWPQGTCPKPWVALVGDSPVRDKRGAVKRYSTEAAALKAAQTYVVEEGETR